jgi:hypothetical protein
MNILERLAVFYERLRTAPPAATAEEALTLICRVLEEVENEFSPMPKQSPPPRTFDGRMYLPQSDNIVKASDNSMWIKTRHHRVRIDPSGAFCVFREMPGRTLRKEFQKVGAAR